jgi:FkbM family methyltransferase
MTNVSWAGSCEDIVLWRALQSVPPEEGFYIDLGANSPVGGSLTKLFYDLGWKGINVEPSPVWFPQLVAARLRDINIQAAASDTVGRLTFYDHPDGGLGTSVKDFAQAHEKKFGMKMPSMEVDTVTLTSLCELYAPPQIHFLKIDVEGHEEQALRGMDFSRFRPWILCIEATAPGQLDVPTHEAWEPLVTGAGYGFTLAHKANRWYVADEHPELRPALSFGPDDYVSWDVLRHIHVLETRVRELEAIVAVK